LFIADALSLSLIEPLLEWAPKVMVLDTALDAVLDWGIKIDCVLAREDRVVMVREKTLEQSPVQILSYKPEDEPLSAGLLLLSLDQKVTYLVTPALENTFALVQHCIPKIQIVILDEQIKWSVVNRFEKWVPKNTSISLRKNNIDQPIVTTGLQARSENIFTSERDGNVSLKSNASFWIGEALD